MSLRVQRGSSFDAMAVVAFREDSFRTKLAKAYERVKQLLDRTRNPVYAPDCQHAYEDKFIMCNLLVRLGLGSMLQTLTALGVSDEHLSTMLQWAKDQTVSLQLKAQEKTTFIKEVVREEEGNTRTETTGHVGSASFAKTTKAVHTVKEYFWKWEASYEIVAFGGVGAEAAQRITIAKRACTEELKTASKNCPRWDHHIWDPVTTDVSWLLRQVSPDRSIGFTINRDDGSCKTPRRNKDVEAILSNLETLYDWCCAVLQYMAGSLFSVVAKEKEFAGINTDGIFVPVLPLMEDSAAFNVAGAGSDMVLAPAASQRTLQPGDVAAFLAEQRRSLLERISTIGSTFPPSESARALSAAEAAASICVMHLRETASQLSESLHLVEHQLYAQLRAAVGRELSSADFNAFARFHSRKLFRPAALPLPFSFAVRRSARHSPEGLLSIEEFEDGHFSPVLTHVRRSVAAEAMSIAISAGTQVQFRGERFVHGWLMHSFSDQGPKRAQLTVQARQLSSFIVLIGRIGSKSSFEAKYGIVVKNKDELRVPLSLTTIPSAKEFKEAVQSMSPEMQEFAKMYRAMQLESTLFALCVVQIKPQLERLLNLPRESLTKEIKLTQDLTELFLEYQIPADLLTAGPVAASSAAAPARSDADKVAEVKGHVGAMRALIEEQKQLQLREAHQTAVFQAISSPQDSMSPTSSNSSRSLFRSDGSDDEDRSFEKEEEEEEKKSKQPSRVRRAVQAVGRVIGLGRHRERLKCDAVEARSRSSCKGSARAASPDGAKECAVESPGEDRGGDMDLDFDDCEDDVMDGEGAAPAEEAGAERLGGEQRGGEVQAAEDYTQLPALLDKRLEALGDAVSVRPTIISAGEVWEKKAWGSLMAKEAAESVLEEEEQRAERVKAFDLLDALTRSGAITLEEASLHVVIGATHCFDSTLVDCVVQGNCNPLTQVEKSALVVAASVQDAPPASLLEERHLPRLQRAAQALLVKQ